MRFFNTAGPIEPEIHYCIPPLQRWDLDEVLSLITQRKYFVLHAPRQTGKTSCLLALADYLNQTGEYRALYANVEAGQAAREDVGRAMRAVLMDIGQRTRDDLNVPIVLDQMEDALRRAGGEGALGAILTDWAADSPLPLVLMLDEVDALIGDTLISLLRQLRAGYNKRPALFPQTVILCGIRDVRDYRIHSSSEKSVITGGSAFNIRAKSLRLGDFSRNEMERLYAEHTQETGQVFEPEALDAAWQPSSGQPWVVNALAYETCFELRDGGDRSRSITAPMIQQAAENLILRRETHLDQLADKLKEPRVRRVIEPLLAGETMDREMNEDDLQYVLDLGLIRRTAAGPQIANGIYREIIPRQLTSITQANLEATVEAAWYIRSDGSPDMQKLLEGFQEFFRENSEHWSQRFEYQEAWPQLLLQAYLQRVVNGGGQVRREYGLGRGRTDLLVVWQHQQFVLELKVLHHSLERTLAEGLKQTAEYMDRQASSEGHLILFDRAPERSWEEKIFRREESVDGKSITVWGM